MPLGKERANVFDPILPIQTVQDIRAIRGRPGKGLLLLKETVGARLEGGLELDDELAGNIRRRSAPRACGGFYTSYNARWLIARVPRIVHRQDISSAFITIPQDSLCRPCDPENPYNPKHDHDSPRTFQKWIHPFTPHLLSLFHLIVGRSNTAG
jgi:hypothetical protein